MVPTVRVVSVNVPARRCYADGGMVGELESFLDEHCKTIDDPDRATYAVVHWANDTWSTLPLDSFYRKAFN